MNWREGTDTLLRDLLVQSHRIALVTDMDGTISPIVDRPEDAYVTERNRALLAKLKGLLALVAVVSGRPVEDLQSRVGLSGLVYVGSHGLERWINDSATVVPAAQQYRPVINRLAVDVEPLTRRYAGLMLENKRISLAVHYRNTADPEAVGAALEPALQKLASALGLALMKGRKVFEFKTPLKVDKGVILEQLVGEYSLDGVIYLGDDTTDLDAMRKVRDLRTHSHQRGLSIAVESSEMPAGLRETADLLAAGVPDIEDFLFWLVENAPGAR